VVLSHTVRMCGCCVNCAARLSAPDWKPPASRKLGRQRIAPLLLAQQGTLLCDAANCLGTACADCGYIYVHD
jgi:hypothetical protein